jgi:hypothetical protein
MKGVISEFLFCMCTEYDLSLNTYAEFVKFDGYNFKTFHLFHVCNFFVPKNSVLHPSHKYYCIIRFWVDKAKRISCCSCAGHEGIQKEQNYKYAQFLNLGLNTLLKGNISPRQITLCPDIVTDIQLKISVSTENSLTRKRHMQKL